MDLASKNSRKKPFEQQMAMLRLSTSSKSMPSWQFFQAGTSLGREFPQIHLVLRQQEEGEKEQYHRLTARSDHIFHIFSSERWKVTENSLRVRNGAQDGSVVTRESVHPSVWYQILLQPAGRSWKPTPHDESSPMNNSCSEQHFLMVFCSTQSNLLEESVLDQLLVGRHQEHSFN